MTPALSAKHSLFARLSGVFYSRHTIKHTKPTVAWMVCQVVHVFYWWYCKPEDSVQPVRINDSADRSLSDPTPLPKSKKTDPHRTPPPTNWFGSPGVAGCTIICSNDSIGYLDALLIKHWVWLSQALFQKLSPDVDRSTLICVISLTTVIKKTVKLWLGRIPCHLKRWSLSHVSPC